MNFNTRKPTEQHLAGPLPAWIAGGVLLLALCLALFAGSPREAQAATSRPNFIIIQTDDQPIEQFNGSWIDPDYRQRRIMPNAQRLIRKEGIEFRSYVTPFPLCSPSRASLLSGDYAHNSGVVRNNGPRGGWEGYRNSQVFTESLPVWLQRAGYRTAHFGKFLNMYGGADLPEETTVPPGWDRWVTDNTDNSTRAFYGYSQNVDGTSTGPIGNPLYGPDAGRDPFGCPWLAPGQCIYHSDSVSLRAVDEIRNADRPFFIQIDYHTPHGDSRPPIGPEPAPRHLDTGYNTLRPNPPGFDEPDTFDKPTHIQALPRLSPSEKWQIRQENQKSVEALQSVDEAIGWIFDALEDTRQLRNTYVIFTSDNGFFLGQHRVSRGKLLPYEAALGVPMAIRGPGIRRSSTSRELVANQDIAPTILDLAGASAGTAVDGRSMVPFWREPNRLSRRAILISSYLASDSIPPEDPNGLVTGPDSEVPAPTGSAASRDASRGARASASPIPPDYVGVRVGPYKYVEYETGERELYDLSRDPAELYNRAGLPAWSEVQVYLDFVLQSMRGCVAAQCRAIQEPWPPAPRSKAKSGRKPNGR
jgi:arylsulfatase A-like enzyme